MILKGESGQTEMKSKKKNISQWLLYVAVVLSPAVFVRILPEEQTRTIATLLALGALPLFFIYMALFTPVRKLFSDNKIYEASSVGVKRFMFGLKSAAGIFAIFMLFILTLPAAKGVYAHKIERQPLSEIAGITTSVDGALFDPYGLVALTINLDNNLNTSYSIWYPSFRPKLHTEYVFKLLPGTTQVVSIREVND